MSRHLQQYGQASDNQLKQKVSARRHAGRGGDRQGDLGADQRDDLKLAEQVIDADDRSTASRWTSRKRCSRRWPCISRSPPTCGSCVAVLKINNDLERMGDLARNIAKRARVPDRAASRSICRPTFARWPTRAQSMVKQSLDALVNSDAALAQKVRDSDDEVDRLRKQVEHVVEDEIAKSPEKTECLVRLDFRLAPPGTAGRHGHSHRRGCNLYGGGGDRPAPARPDRGAGVAALSRACHTHTCRGHVEFGL